MKRMLLCALMLCFMLIAVPLIALGGVSEWGEVLSGRSWQGLSQSSVPEGSQLETEKLTLSHVKDPEGFILFDKASESLIKVTAKEFLYGAVACEMPISSEDEALKAQAVACHSYYAQKRDAERAAPNAELHGGDFAVDTGEWSVYTTKEQLQNKWGSKFEDNYSRLTRLVDEVSDVMMLYNGSPIVAAFHSISGGRTEDAFNVWGTEYPYLKAVESPGDVLAPDYQTIVSFSAEKFKNILEKRVNGIKLGDKPEKWVGELSKTPSGTVIMCGVGDRKASGSELRSFFSLRSAVFDLVYRDGKFIFTVRGYGHGVGMSQYGAQEMARQGAGYSEILQWYYRTDSQSGLGI